MEDIWEWVHLTSGTYHIINQNNVDESLSIQHGWTSQTHGSLQAWFYTCVHTCQSARTHVHTHTQTHQSKTANFGEMKKIDKRKWNKQKYFYRGSRHYTIYSMRCLQGEAYTQWSSSPHMCGWDATYLGSWLSIRLAACHASFGILSYSKVTFAFFPPESMKLACLSCMWTLTLTARFAWTFWFQVFPWSVLLMQLGQNVFSPEMSLCLKSSVTITKVADLMKSSLLTMSTLYDYLHGTWCYFKLFCLFNNVFSFSSTLRC